MITLLSILISSLIRCLKVPFKPPTFAVASLLQLHLVKSMHVVAVYHVTIVAIDMGC